MKKLLLPFIVLLFIGCDSVPVIEQNNYNGGPIMVTEGVYFKKIYIQGVAALLRCDKNGNILDNQNTPISYRVGKTQSNATTLTINQNDETKGQFNFSCSDIEDCYNQISIVKKSLGK